VALKWQKYLQFKSEIYLAYVGVNWMFDTDDGLLNLANVIVLIVGKSLFVIWFIVTIENTDIVFI